METKEGERVKPHRGSIAWNEYLKAWVTIFVEEGGKPSYLGELWFARADSPFGPWCDAIKVLSHANYSFYNPRIQTELMPKGADFLLFEGTRSKMFADKPEPTPRYDYNQILYRLDLNALR